MRGLGYICSKQFSLAELAKSYSKMSYAGRPVVAFVEKTGDVPRLRVSGRFGYFELELVDSGFELYAESGDLEQIRHLVPNPYFYSGDYGPHDKALEAARFAISSFPMSEGVLVHDDIGPIMPIAQAKKLIEEGKPWHFLDSK